MSRKYPTVEHFVRGQVRSIDDDGQFDTDTLILTDEFKIPQRLLDTDTIGLEADPSRVLLKLTEICVATFNGGDAITPPLYEFSMLSISLRKTFFRTGVHPTDPILTQFAGVPDILSNPDLQSDELKKLIEYIPLRELNLFGVGCLKQVLK